MTAFDIAVLGVVAASLLLGLWRGVVSEILALAAWVAGFIAGRALAPDVAAMLGGLVADATLRYAAGFAAVFVGVLIVFSIGRLALALMLRAVGLGLVDRFFGAVFGIGRGALIAFIAVLLGGMTALPKETWWREAVLAPPLETAAIAARPWLPPEMARRIRYR
ncbi:MAG: CvpA family protein [Candidatus Nitricoxidivorans perseverans]|uniref:CvpA family protein n=1 Tax=Candidatus Nitricoxidivorans perseverans TaxID=2975601 RepID=A0AA49FNG9_9PROT|nr:MAG: CvpA family protein [Candidatus Nitricoxidivorans perseverans]